MAWLVAIVLVPLVFMIAATYAVLNLKVAAFVLHLISAPLAMRRR
jgi:hypothetical protein